MNFSLLIFSERGRKKWNNESILLFLTTLIELQYNPVKNPLRKREMFGKVKDVFEEKGYLLSVEDLGKKWSNLLQTFRKIKDKKKSTGEERHSWVYYDVSIYHGCRFLFFNFFNIKKKNFLSSKCQFFILKSDYIININ